MKIGDKLQKLLQKPYPPDQLVAVKFGRYDVAFKTNGEGKPILLFVGKANEQGRIKGDQFTRQLIKRADGTVEKDHWDYKGKV